MVSMLKLYQQSQYPNIPLILLFLKWVIFCPFVFRVQISRLLMHCSTPFKLLRNDFFVRLSTKVLAVRHLKILLVVYKRNEPLAPSKIFAGPLPCSMLKQEFLKPPTYLRGRSVIVHRSFKMAWHCPRNYKKNIKARRHKKEQKKKTSESQRSVYKVLKNLALL